MYICIYGIYVWMYVLSSLITIIICDFTVEMVISWLYIDICMCIYIYIYTYINRKWFFYSTPPPVSLSSSIQRFTIDSWFEEFGIFFFQLVTYYGVNITKVASGSLWKLLEEKIISISALQRRVSRRVRCTTYMQTYTRIHTHTQTHTHAYIHT